MNRKPLYTKLGYDAEVGYHTAYGFERIEIKKRDWEFIFDGGLKLATHINGDQFLVNVRDEMTKYYNGEPCIYTDVNYTLGMFDNVIYWKRRKGRSLKTMKRIANKIYNLPKGYVFCFEKPYYFTTKNFSPSYFYKPKRKVKEFKYEINDESFNKIPVIKTTPTWNYLGLINLLRDNGFLVKVMESNENMISSMIRSAQAITGSEPMDLKEEELTYSFVAYGHGKKIGFTVDEDELFGYSYGIKSVLWDWCHEFDKWSKCYEIPKTMPIEEILVELMKVKELDDEDQ